MCQSALARATPSVSMGSMFRTRKSCRDSTDCTKRILESKFRSALKVWRVMATSSLCLIKSDGPGSKKSAIRFARPKVDPLLLRALLGLPAHRRQLLLRLLRIDFRRQAEKYLRSLHAA